MPSIYKRILFLATLIFAVTICVNAQQATDESQRSLLPDIDPQDIEIRTQFQARFPGLRRQPILGFNPQPRIFQIDADRLPFIEDEDAIAASVPVGELDRPDAPGYKPLTYQDPNNGFARIGIGSHISSEADIYAITRLGESNWISGNINHNSSASHLDNQNSGYRLFNGVVRSQHRLSRNTTLRLHAGGLSDFNYLPLNVTQNDFIAGSDGRVTQSGYRGGATLSSDRNNIAGWRASLNGYGNNFEIADAAGITQNGSAAEWGVSGSAEYSWLGSRVEEVYRINAGVKTGGIDPIDQASDTWSLTYAKAGYDRVFNYETDVSLEMGMSFVSDPVNGTRFYPTPRAEVRHTIFSGLDVRGLFSGQPQFNSLSDFRSNNRFIRLTDHVQHQYELEGRGEIIFEPLGGTTLSAGVGYMTVQNSPYFTRERDQNSNGDLEFGPYQINFDDASFLRMYGAFTQKLVPEKLWIEAEGFIQRPRLSNGDKIPFTEAMKIKGTISIRPAASVLLQGWAELTGSRFHPDGSDLSEFGLFGAKFEVSFTERFGFYGKLINVTDTQYEIWQGYPERGFQGFAGITYLF